MAEVRTATITQDLVDPLEFQHRLLTNESLPIGLRATVAASIAPYFHPKLGIALFPRFIETPIEAPDFKSIEEAESFLASLATRFAASELGAQSALDLSTLVRNWISAKHAAAELEIKRLNASASGDGVLRIEGGLPALPGTEIIMPPVGGSPLNPTDASPGPLSAPVPVVPTTTLQRLEAALEAWSQGGRKGNVEIDEKTWDDMGSIPRDVLQALFDKYGVACPITDTPEG